VKTIRRLPHSPLRLQTRLFLAAPIILLLLATQDMTVAQSVSGNFSALSGDLNADDRILLRTKKIYVTSFQDDMVEVFSLRGSDLGVFVRVLGPTGLVFDDVGNLYVSSDRRPYLIDKFAPDGTGSIFADSGSGLNGPHALVFDEASNLYVANAFGDTIEKFTPDGVGTVFADHADGLDTPIDLAFDTAGNLYVSNLSGGPTHTGSVLKFTPDGVGSVFADSGFDSPFGLAFDRAGNLYVSNLDSNTVEEFSPTGEDLGVFASTGLAGPLGMMFDRDGYLYVANRGNSTIEKFSPTGEDLGVFAQTGDGPHFLTMFRPR
jgi:DNA-binding beta-propeller fold protein YncE